MATSIIINNLSLFPQISYSIDEYKREIEAKEERKKRLMRNNNAANQYKVTDTITYEITSCSEYHTRIFSYNELITKNNISFAIERQYQKLIKFKKRSLSFDKPKINNTKPLTLETFNFTIEGGNEQIEISDYSIDNKGGALNHLPYVTEPGNIQKQRNILEDYLPKTTFGGQYLYQPQGLVQTEYNNNAALDGELNMLNEQYETIKHNLIELNPILKSNANVREQFFINVSEGKEERYIFFTNLYNIINESSELNKPVFEIKKLQMKYFRNTNKLNPVNKNKKPLPSLQSKLIKEMNDKRKINHYVIGSNKNNHNNNNCKQLMPLLVKSSSGNNINPKYTLLPYFAK